ncbi:exodeoxyribonuclease VII small subunit [Wohlfahrtiimonas larvae]|uniref:Exodeoxyribonuclease 7 small subunit n=1 Tax=Wohlfahrtiimonas larvae TaxID=1157986 RepID=A0ABP9MTP2_9GAMM|nr:exodeoxyribonuclease VII small subunit [Wohlfahrtiimonas larvae]
MAKSKNTSETIEDKLNSIDTIIEQLESGELTLEASLKLFTDGTQLIHDCRNILDHTAKKIEEITQSKITTPLTDDFDNDDIPF